MSQSEIAAIAARLLGRGGESPALSSQAPGGGYRGPSAASPPASVRPVASPRYVLEQQRERYYTPVLQAGAPAPASFGRAEAPASTKTVHREAPATPLPYDTNKDGFVAKIMAAQARTRPSNAATAYDYAPTTDPSIGAGGEYDGFTASIAANVQWRRRYGPGVPDFVAEEHSASGNSAPQTFFQTLGGGIDTPELLDEHLAQVGQVQRQMHSILARKSVFDEQLEAEAALSAVLAADASRKAAERFALAAEYVAIECTAQTAHHVALDLGKTHDTGVPFGASNPVHKLASEAEWVAAPRPTTAGEFECGDLVLCALDWNADVKRYARVVRVNGGPRPSVVLMTDAVFHSVGSNSSEPIGELVRHVPANGTRRIPSRRAVSIPSSAFVAAYEWLPTAEMLRHRHLAKWFDKALAGVTSVVLERRTGLFPQPRELVRTPGARESDGFDYVQSAMTVAGPTVSVDLFPGRTDLMVAQMVRSLPNVRTWNLRGATRVTEISIGVLASIGRQVEVLNLAECPLIADRTFISLAACFTSLKHLDLSGCHRLIGSCLPALARASRGLTSLRLAGCSELDDTLVSKAIDMCAATLTRVDFSDCHRLQMGTATALARCVHLKHLSLDGCWQMEDAAVKKILDTRTSLDGYTIRLKTLSLSGIVVSEGTLKSGVRGQVLLNSLSLGECPALNNDVLESIIESTPALRDLTISNSDWVNDSTLYMLARFAAPIVEVGSRAPFTLRPRSFARSLSLSLFVTIVRASHASPPSLPPFLPHCSAWRWRRSASRPEPRCSGRAAQFSSRRSQAPGGGRTQHW
jgi:hypothetical protein